MNWAQINNMRKKHIRFGERMFRRMYSRARTELRRRMERVETFGELEMLVAQTEIEENVTEAFEVFYRRAGVDFAQQTYRRFKSATGMEVKEDEGLISMWELMMTAYVLDECGEKIANVINTHRTTYQRILNGAVRQGMDEGWGVERVSREILRQGIRREKWQAMRIARTEVLSASNYGSLKGAESTGIPMVKRWVASSAADPREDHQAMDGVVVNFQDMFQLPSGVRLEYPGDPSGPASEIINCQCGCITEPKKEL